MKHASDKFKVTAAKVEVAHARFADAEDLGIEFKNEIDAWTKMEVVFREQIKLLRVSGDEALVMYAKPKRKNRQDLKSLVYSIREKLE